MTGRIIYLCIVFVVSFLFVLNLYLRGLLRVITECVLSLTLIGLVTSSFILFSWKYGLITLALTIVFLSLSKPFALSLAHRMLGFRTGIAPDVSGSGLFNNLEQGKLSWSAYLDAEAKEKENRIRKLNKALGNSKLKSIVDNYGMTVEDLYELYTYLPICGLQDLSWDIITNANDLEKLIRMRIDGKSAFDISMAFRYASGNKTDNYES